MADELSRKFTGPYCRRFHKESEGFIKLIAGVLVFGLIVFITNALIIKRHHKMDSAEIATYVVIIALGSLCWGLLLSKCAK